MRLPFRAASASLAAVAFFCVISTNAQETVYQLPVEKDSEGRIRAKDTKGREWLLEDWHEGTSRFPAPENPTKREECLKNTARPYPKDLNEREAWYRKKWGENWDGPVSKRGVWVYSPGDWKWEAVAALEEPLSSQLWITKYEAHPHHHMKWGGIWPECFTFAPGAGEATDVYVSTGLGFLHVDLKTKKLTPLFTAKGRVLEPEQGSAYQTYETKDGIVGQGAIFAFGAADESPSLDQVTGRIYWRNPWQLSRSNYQLRYLEKLLPYEDKKTGKEYLLPAILEFKELYKRLPAPSGGVFEQVLRNGRRADPVFVIKTLTKFKTPKLPGSAKGKRPLLTPDHKALYLSNGAEGWGSPATHFDLLADLESGQAKPINLAGSLPPEMSGGHGGCCLAYDGNYYECDHFGCGGGPMRLFSIEPTSGRVTFLYDSSSKLHKKPGNLLNSPGLLDGPADAQTLQAVSTKWQIQCPRTGAIYNGGWDGSGLRRYHDGFVTTLYSGGANGRDTWPQASAFNGDSNGVQGTFAPNGDVYVADPGFIPQRIVRIYRADWPKEQPEYGYGEKFMPKARLEELMREYAQKYIANHEAESKF